MIQILDEVLSANAVYIAGFGEKGLLARPPARRFAVLDVQESVWLEKRFGALLITHDVEEAVALDNPKSRLSTGCRHARIIDSAKSFSHAQPRGLADQRLNLLRGNGRCSATLRAVRHAYQLLGSNGLAEGLSAVEENAAYYLVS